MPTGLRQKYISRKEDNNGKRKDTKTNAMRILDRLKISYEVLSYQCDEFIDGIHTADTLGIPHENCFKTLVLQERARDIVYLFFQSRKN